MTRDEILNMPAGREMDALVARLVFSFVKRDDGKYYRIVNGEGVAVCETPLFYSTDIRAAWELSLFFAKRGWEVTVEYSTVDGLENPAWRCWLNYFTDNPDDYRGVEGAADFAPLAICRAALLAVMEAE